MVDPTAFRPFNLGDILVQSQQLEGQREDRQLRLGEIAARTQQSQQEAARQRAQTLGRLARGVRGVPLEQRGAVIQRLTPQLRAMGVSDQEIAGFDPSDANLDALAALSGDREAQPSGLQRDYEFLESVEPGLGRQFARNRAEGSPVVQRNEDGTITVYPRHMLGGTETPTPQQETTAVNPQTGERIRLNPQTGQWESAGGASQSSGSPTFP